MNKVQLRWMTRTLVLTLTIVALTSLGLGTTSARAQAGSQTLRQSMAPQCDANALMHAATQEYRMFYDQSYITEQRRAAAANRYRQLYDQSYITEQRRAAATMHDCLAGR